MNTIDPFMAARRTAAYHELCPLPATASRSIDAYVHVRGAIVLGQFTQARELLDQYQTQGSPLCLFSQTLLSIQLQVFADLKFENALSSLMSLCDVLPDDRYLRGEWYFFQGFCHNHADQFVLGLTAFRLAAEHYAAAQLSTLEAIARFNMCVCLNHLGRHQEFQSCFQTLSQLTNIAATPAAQLHQQMLQFFILIDCEEFAKANALANNLLQLATQLHRWRDVATVLSLNWYVTLKLGSSLAAFHSNTDYKHYKEKLSFDARATLDAFAAVEELGMIQAIDAERIDKLWQRTVANSVHYLHLLDALIERCKASDLWTTVLKLAERAARESTKLQQSAHLLDFQYHQVEATIMLGQTTKARHLLDQYGRFAVSRNISHRLIKLQTLKKLAQSVNQLTSTNHSTGLPALEYDTNLRTVTIDGRVVSLKNSPLIWHALSILQKHPDGMGLDAFYRELYAATFHPLRHERRIAAIVARIRSLLDSPTALERKDGTIRLLCHFLNPPLHERRSYRQRDLLQLIAKAGRPVAIQDIEKRFSLTRRMLQMDLKQLIESGQIATSGSTKAKRYYIQNQSSTTEEATYDQHR